MKSDHEAIRKRHPSKTKESRPAVVVKPTTARSECPSQRKKGAGARVSLDGRKHLSSRRVQALCQGTEKSLAALSFLSHSYTVHSLPLNPLSVWSLSPPKHTTHS